MTTTAPLPHHHYYQEAVWRAEKEEAARLAQDGDRTGYRWATVACTLRGRVFTPPAVNHAQPTSPTRARNVPPPAEPYFNRVTYVLS